MSHIEVEDLQKVFRTREHEEVRALTDVNLTIRSGEFVALLGPSGCGKTTLLNIIAGIVAPTSGRAEVDGHPPHRRAPGEAMPGFVFQSPVLLPWRTAIENVLLPSQVGSFKDRVRQNGDKAKVRDKAQSLLAMVGLGEFVDKYPDELSGGMQQRVAIARALIQSSGLTLMDEPFSALDEFTREEMQLELLRVWTRESPTVVFVTHNVYEAVFLADRVIVMSPRPGRIVQDVAVALPRPRDISILRTDEFGGEVRRVREALEGHWHG